VIDMVVIMLIRDGQYHDSVVTLIMTRAMRMMIVVVDADLWVWVCLRCGSEVFECDGAVLAVGINGAKNIVRSAPVSQAIISGPSHSPS
jgi:hypothetical protein